MVEIKEDSKVLQLKPVPSYYEVKWNETKEAEKKRDDKFKEMFLKTLEFYEKNYPNTKYKNIWDSKKELLSFNKEISFKDNIEHYTEPKLLVARLVLDYALQEKLHNQDMSVRNMQLEIRGLIMRLIPASRYLDEEDKLKREAQKIEERKKEIETIRLKERKDLEERVKKPIVIPPPLQTNVIQEIKKEEVVQKPVEIPKVEQPIVKEETLKEIVIKQVDGKFPCPLCASTIPKVCVSASGLVNHLRMIHKVAGITSPSNNNNIGVVI